MRAEEDHAGKVGQGGTDQQVEDPLADCTAEPIAVEIPGAAQVSHNLAAADRLHDFRGEPRTADRDQRLGRPVVADRIFYAKSGDAAACTVDRTEDEANQRPEEGVGQQSRDVGAAIDGGAAKRADRDLIVKAHRTSDQELLQYGIMLDQLRKAHAVQAGRGWYHDICDAWDSG